MAVEKVDWFRGQNWHLRPWGQPGSAEMSQAGLGHFRLTLLLLEMLFVTCWICALIQMWFLAVCVTLPSCFIQSRHHLRAPSQPFFTYIFKWVSAVNAFHVTAINKGFSPWNESNSVYWIYLAHPVSLLGRLCIVTDFLIRFTNYRPGSILIWYWFIWEYVMYTMACFIT